MSRTSLSRKTLEPKVIPTVPPMTTSSAADGLLLGSCVGDALGSWVSSSSGFPDEGGRGKDSLCVGGKDKDSLGVGGKDRDSLGALPSANVGETVLLGEGAADPELPAPPSSPGPPSPGVGGTVELVDGGDEVPGSPGPDGASPGDGARVSSMEGDAASPTSGASASSDGAAVSSAEGAPGPAGPKVGDGESVRPDVGTGVWTVPS